jgi:hypothetical protein
LAERSLRPIARCALNAKSRVKAKPSFPKEFVAAFSERWAANSKVMSKMNRRELLLKRVGVVVGGAVAGAGLVLLNACRGEIGFGPGPSNLNPGSEIGPCPLNPGKRGRSMLTKVY